MAHLCRPEGFGRSTRDARAAPGRRTCDMEENPIQPDEPSAPAPLPGEDLAGTLSAPVPPADPSPHSAAARAGWIVLLVLLWGASAVADYLLAPDAWMGPAGLGLLFAIAGGVWLHVEGAPAA